MTKNFRQIDVFERKNGLCFGLIIIEQPVHYRTSLFSLQPCLKCFCQYKCTLGIKVGGVILFTSSVIATFSIKATYYNCVYSFWRILFFLPNQFMFCCSHTPAPNSQHLLNCNRLLTQSRQHRHRGMASSERWELCPALQSDSKCFLPSPRGGQVKRHRLKHGTRENFLFQPEC